MPAISQLLHRCALRLLIETSIGDVVVVDTPKPVHLSYCFYSFAVLLATNCSQISMLQMTVDFYRVTSPYRQTLSRKYTMINQLSK